MQGLINPSRRSFLSVTAAALAAANFNAISSATTRSELSSLERATAWLNTQPLSDQQLQGKVVLVEFWTYSCINWRRQLPYVRAWDEKYRERGLVTVGVHAPEFSFERNITNVRWAVNDMHISYPIAIDNDYSIWRAFNNEYWPALYFIDLKGRIRHQVFGEGQYEQSEALIQKLLTEAGRSKIGIELVSIHARGAEAPADWKELRSGENYVSYKRTEGFVSRGGIKVNQAHVYTAPEKLRLNEWALSGDWTVGSEVIALYRPDGSILYCFHARDLHAVIGPTVPGQSVRFRLLIDGREPGVDHGVDIDDGGNGIITEPRMYQLIRQQSHILDRQVTIQFLDSGVEAYSFTFG